MADSEHELLPLPGSNSTIWTYFRFLAKEGKFVEKDKRKRNTVICKTCKREFVYTESTTNLIVDLRNHHTKEYAMMLERQQNSEGLKEPSKTKAAVHRSSLKNHLSPTRRFLTAPPGGKN